MKKQYSIKELEQEMPLTEGWLRRMEKDGHIKLKSPKVRGQVKRLFDKSDVVNALWLASLRVLGFGPKKLTWYKKTIKRFKSQVSPLLKRHYKEPDDQVFLFSVADICPDGDVDNLDWGKLDSEEYNHLFEDMAVLYKEAFLLSQKARTTRSALEHTEKTLNKFMDDLEEGMGRTISGFALLDMFKGLRKTK
jgi:hypothetical protein